MNMTASPSWTETYGTETSISCSADNSEATPQLYMNSSLVPIPDIQTLAANQYQYTCNASTTQNYTSDTTSNTLTINKAASAVSLLLNGTASDITIERMSDMNLTAERLTGTGNVQLFRNGTSLGTGVSVTDTSKYNSESTYNVTAYYESTENHSSGEQTYWLIVDDTIPPGPITNILLLNKGLNYLYWVWTNPADSDFDHVEIYINDSFRSNTANEYYYATGLSDSTTYTISVRTVDRYGNQDVWVNNTQITEYSCIEAWTTNHTGCALNDTRVKYYTDTAACGTTHTLPGDNGTTEACDCVNQDTLNGSTTDLTGNNLTDMQGVILEVWPYATVEFIDTITISSCIDLDPYVRIGPGYVSINTTQLPELNRSANITVYNLNFTLPQIMLDGSVCPNTTCAEINYSGGTYKFNVTHFTNYSVREGPYCGDTSCNGGESCSSCALDCGACAAPGGGGGGGGGAAPRAATCEPEWLCYSWGACDKNQQTRSCFDANACKNDTTRPATTQFCVAGCTERWACGDWGKCTESGVRTRTCNDLAQCGTDDRKSQTVEPCEYDFCSDGKKNNDETGIDCGGSCRECTDDEEKEEEERARRNLLTGEAITVQPYEQPNPVYILPLLLLIALLIAVVALHKSKKICGRAKHILTAVHILLILAIIILAIVTFDADEMTGQAVAEIVTEIGVREIFILLLSSALIIGAITYVTLHQGMHICEIDPERISPFTRMKDAMTRIKGCFTRKNRDESTIECSRRGLDEFKQATQSSWSYVFEKNRKDRQEIREISNDPLGALKKQKEEKRAAAIAGISPEEIRREIIEVEQLKAGILKKLKRKTSPKVLIDVALEKSKVPKKAGGTDIEDINARIDDIRRRIAKIKR
ncbi:MAG: hypothetical protein ABIA62_08240 [Candidatus Woesearchaeota archaeon]